MIEARVVEAVTPLFVTHREVEQYGYVLVKDKGKITGIVTATDVASALVLLSQPFIRIGTIGRLIRNKLHPCLSQADFSHLEQHSRALADRDFARLTFGENVRLMERSEIWNRMKLAVDKVEFIKRLRDVGDIRNDVMHYGPDPLTSEQTKSLEQMESFLRHVFG